MMIKVSAHKITCGEIMKVRFILVILLLFYDGYGESATEPDDIRQDGAKVLYWNPKYLKSINFITRRKDRSSPYLTSGNATLIYPFGNNLTVTFECFSVKTKRELFSLDFKICEVIMIPWAKEWAKRYSNVPMECPVPQGTYTFNELELPPKNFPIELPVGDYGILISFVMTKTKEKIVDIKVNLRIGTKKHKLF